MTYPDTQLFIDDQWLDAAEGRTIDVHNPATGQVIGRVAHATKQDLDRAADSVRRGFEVWRDHTPAQRSKIMRKAAELVRARVDEIAALMTREQGKPLVEAKGEILAGADIIDWFADEGLRVYGRLVPHRANPAIQQLVIKDPVGPVAAFTPWNFPINQVVRKLGAGLAAGCSMIVKAPEETPASPAALVRAFQDAGLPAGVLALVYGNPAEISEHLIAHPVIRKITFTGSTAVGKQLAALAGRHMKRVSMELGGHAPVIVCEDADIELAVKTMSRAKFRNAGQVCISPTRFLVHESVRQDFAKAFAEVATGLNVGDGLAEGTEMGPLANTRRVDAMSALYADAVERGATVLSGGKRIGDEGNFWAPTVLDDVPAEAKLFNEEPFGPVAAIRGFQDLDEAVTEANRLSYGLAGYAFTRSLATADQLTRKVEVGMLWVNMPAMPSAELPFGGVKDSGYGSEGGPEAMEAYLNTRAVSIAHQ
ncbi:NAD-dependent succinate-semialdehyde dehydrogenase [Prauserella sp. PE36]|uniref:NAD-dependent succinate-semialdehyde dehydrogenase n=1 Tax=Prauserella endophytica TaxID=1592324 RepID=A0ABY2S9Y7_9PSEU|nr:MULTISPECIES: NAD-dependent succinate-semialdehyde dehydrogenase [Prauserella]PXY29029.1 NAD-dependent succinate-semialdehyde dehydrogenase [Prauserella coralliicola]RBM14756.1 NAD-dependent succinate-semialdehyde dehydrogenase [Prauserella sp. PE36]TKG72718.1 NAD-dependent succinate-semialdehyde dehydrogenase [Prauserella endophytica]